MLTLEGYIVILVVILTIIALAKEIMRSGLVFFTAAVILMSTGIITNQELLAGFSNKGMITVGILFLVSEGVRQSGMLNRMAQSYLPRKRGRLFFLIPRIILPVSALSAFLNNTPLVIIFAPIIKKWAEKLNLSYKKFLIPLSYATILGGICTLIGTSTNLVVHGLMIDNGMKGFSMFELGKVGLPIAIVGILYIAIFANRLLPGEKILINNKSTLAEKDYYYNIFIPENSNLIGKETINGRLKELSKLHILSIERDGNSIDTSQGIFKILPGDKLLLAGKSERLNFILTNENISLCGFEKIKHVPRRKLKQYEAVLSPRFPGIGATIPEFNFYEHYQAVVLAIHRNGERITSNIDNLKLRAGDNLVLLTTNQFIQTWGDSKIFYLTSFIRDYRDTGNFWSKWLAFIILTVMIIGATVGQYFPSPAGLTFDMFFFSLLAVVLLVWLKIMPHQKYTKSISWDVLITIACSFAISKALQNSGAAEILARNTINISRGLGPMGVLVALYLITNLFTEIVTNNAAAALVFPIALAAAHQLQIDPKPLLVAVTIAASASFSTPIGYQTNLIVQAIGDYKFKDFLKIGIALNILTFLLSMILIPLFWQF